MRVAENKTTEFEKSLKDNPIELTLRMEYDDYLFVSNGDLVEEKEEDKNDGYRTIWMYAEDGNGELISYAEVVIDIETREAWSWEFVQSNEPKPQYEYNY